MKLRTISWYLMVFSRYLRDKIASYLLGTEPLKAPLTTGLALPKNILNGGVKRHGRSVPPNRKSEANSLSLQPYRVAEIEILIARVVQG